MHRQVLYLVSHLVWSKVPEQEVRDERKTGNGVKQREMWYYATSQTIDHQNPRGILPSSFAVYAQK